MFIRPYAYLCLLLTMLLLNGKPVRNPRSIVYDAVKTSEVDGKEKIDELVQNSSGNVYLLGRNGKKVFMIPSAGGDSGSCNTQIVATNDAIVIFGAKTSVDNEPMTNVTKPPTDVVTHVSDDEVTAVSDSSSSSTETVSSDDITTVDGEDGVSSEAPDTTTTDSAETVSSDDITTVDGEDGVSSEAPDTRTTEDGDDEISTTDPVEPGKENDTLDCNLNVIIAGFPGIFFPYPSSPMQPVYGGSPFPGQSPMYQPPYEQDMVLRATAHDAPLAARAYEALNTAQSLSTSRKCRISVFIIGGHCYHFILTKSPTSTGLPYNITNLAPISCPHGVFP
ncbi:hypothetical protein PHET_05976 [Paragonimus heterotremus]|uniref:Uncharacterized protein n=1 Tax=Paragonimus heterotremus TaxID=100268 RepID=A0A8J4WHT3_9TREM|nr:hypothetical protein PHET_05976 [Paragonimus heterotremus]